MQPFKYKPNFNSGDFRHFIKIQTLIETEDELGQSTKTWQDYKSVWSIIKTIQGREYFEAASTQNENTARFIIRYTTGINESMRIVYKDKAYNIESVINDDELDKTLTIIAKG